MATPHDCLKVRDEVLSHLLADKRLGAELREEYFQCVDCIVAVTEQLEKHRMEHSTINGDGSQKASMSDDPAIAEAARAALARGLRVLEREFGIKAKQPADAK